MEPTVKKTSKLLIDPNNILKSSFHRLDIILAVVEALNPNKPNQTLKCFSFVFKNWCITYKFCKGPVQKYRNTTNPSCRSKEKNNVCYLVEKRPGSDPGNDCVIVFLISTFLLSTTRFKKISNFTLHHLLATKV